MSRISRLLSGVLLVTVLAGSLALAFRVVSDWRVWRRASDE